MPNCFRLISRETNEAEAFKVIDEKMCKYFQVGCDPKKYYMHWFDSAGFGIACGQSLPEQIAHITKWIEANPLDNEAIDYKEILIWLDNNYIGEAWVQIGK